MTDSFMNFAAGLDSIVTPSEAKNRGANHLRKGDMTRKAIVEQALRLASVRDLDSLSLGLVAEHMEMSKSGVRAHFRSMQLLKIEVLRQYRCELEVNVLYPCIAVSAGLPRMKSMFYHWIQHIASPRRAGCFYINCAAEYGGRPGPIRDELMKNIHDWRAELDSLVQQAINVGHLHQGTEVKQVVYEIDGLILAFHHHTKLSRDVENAMRTQHAFERLLEKCQRDRYTIADRNES